MTKSKALSDFIMTPPPPRPRAKLEIRNGKYVIIEAKMGPSNRTPCGAVLATNVRPTNIEATPGIRLVACITCGDEPFGNCEDCGRWGQP